MKRFILLLFFCVCCLHSHAQDMATLFVNMPDQQIPQLETAWRKDLVELFQKGKESRVQNLMGGYTQMKNLTADYMLLQLTDRTTVEMKLLPLVNNTPVICMITTVYGPAPDSRVAFYSPDWQQLDAAEFFTPASTSWFLKEKETESDGVAYYEAVTRLDMDLIHYELNPDSLLLTATYATPQYLSKEERDRVLPYLKEEPKVYTWEKIRFK
ncbi:DUF3256 family protein [Parabacteroides sp. OttesenSCG-928-K15]|nr:DUF3256 family protein [Parabacteroides sp. OttesenSCG-928-K15]